MTLDAGGTNFRFSAMRGGKAVTEMVHDEYLRDVARTTLSAKEADSFDDIVVPDYGAVPDVVIDVITLDSTSKW